MGDDALLLAPDDGDMDFGDINCDLLDADDDDVSGTVAIAINQEGSSAVSSKGDDLRQKMELKKIGRMSSGVFESSSKKKAPQSGNRGSQFKNMPFGNYKRRTSPPSENVKRGFNSPEKQKIFTKNYKIPMNKDPRSRPPMVETPKSPVQNRPPLFTKNYRNQLKSQSPSSAGESLPRKVDVTSPAQVSGPANTFPPDFSMPPPSNAKMASRLVVSRDPQPSTPKSCSSPVFRFGVPSPKNSPPASSLLNTSIEQLEKMKSQHEAKKREEEARMEELERVLARKKMEEEIKRKEREREAALIRQLKMKQDLEASPPKQMDFNLPQNTFPGEARVNVDMASMMAQQLRMMHDMTNSFMTNMAEREAERKRIQEKREMTELKSSIRNMEQMLYSGQINKSPHPSTFARIPSHAYMDRHRGTMPVRERLALPIRDKFDKSRLSSYNNNEPASKRFKSGYGKFGDGMNLPDDLVLTEITENGPKAARKKISYSSD